MSRSGKCNLLPYRSNQSGYIGVDWHILTQKWRATAKAGGRKIHIGSFTNKKNAIRAAKDVRHKIIDGATPEIIYRFIQRFRKIKRDNPYTGAWWSTKDKKYIAIVNWDGQRYFCGTYKSKERAEKSVYNKRKSLGILD